MSTQPNTDSSRPELLDARVMIHTPERMVEYVEIDGLSPEITNHASRLDIVVLRGTGRIATHAMGASLEPGSQATILPGQRHALNGQLDLLVTSTPPTMPSFVTLGNQKLGSLQKMMLREQAKEARRAASLAQAEEEFRKLINKVLPEFEAMEAIFYRARYSETA